MVVHAVRLNGAVRPGPLARQSSRVSVFGPPKVRVWVGPPVQWFVFAYKAAPSAPFW